MDMVRTKEARGWADEASAACQRAQRVAEGSTNPDVLSLVSIAAQAAVKAQIAAQHGNLSAAREAALEAYEACLAIEIER